MKSRFILYMEYQEIHTKRNNDVIGYNLLRMNFYKPCALDKQDQNNILHRKRYIIKWLLSFQWYDVDHVLF